MSLCVVSCRSDFFAEKAVMDRESATAHTLMVKNERRSHVQMFRK